MNILDALQMVNQFGAAKELGSDIMQAMEPMKQGFDNVKFQLADQMGLTKEIVDEGDASIQKVIDQEAFNRSMGNIANTASQMRPEMPAAPQGLQMPQGQANPMPQMQQPAVNPYAPVNYGTMSQQPQMGGIGSAPSMEQILRALQSQQR